MSGFHPISRLERVQGLHASPADSPWAGTCGRRQSEERHLRSPAGIVADSTDGVRCILPPSLSLRPRASAGQASFREGVRAQQQA